MQKMQCWELFAGTALLVSQSESVTRQDNNTESPDTACDSGLLGEAWLCSSGRSLCALSGVSF